MLLNLWSHEPIWRHLSIPRQCPHFRSRDEIKILLPVGVKEGHGLVLGVVGGNLEGDDLELGEAGGHAQHLAAVCRLVDVSFGRVWVRHSSGVLIR